MSGVARMGALTARTAVRSRQVLKTRGDAYWTHKGSTLSPLLLVCLHQSAFGTPRLALYKYTLPPVLYFHGRGEGGGWRAALRAQPQQLRCCTELVRALLRDVAPSAHVLKWALSVQLCWLTVAQLVRVRARTAGMATRKSENMLAARQLKLPKKRRSLQARTHVLRGDCGGRASTSHSLPKTRCLPSPPSPKHSCGASMKFGRFISLPLLAASFYCASTLRTSAPSISQCTASTPSSTRFQHFLHPEHSQRLHNTTCGLKFTQFV